MAPRTSQNEDTFTEVNNPDEWQEVESELMIKLENVGDEFTGVFHGMDQQAGSGIWQAHFTLTEPEPGKAFINAGYDLRKKLNTVPPGRMTKVIYTDNLDTGQETPMRVFKVLTARR